MYDDGAETETDRADEAIMYQSIYQQIQGTKPVCVVNSAAWKASIETRKWVILTVILMAVT